MVDGLFFCATLTGRRGGHTPFVRAGAETSDTGAEAVKSNPGCPWEGRSGGLQFTFLLLLQQWFSTISLREPNIDLQFY